jgi:trans-aconitate 2-methyltransferase
VKFEDERTRAVRDLLGAMPDVTARTALDLGCGPGNSTALLAARFPAAAVRGIDSSPDMIDAARTRLEVRFDVDSIERWLDRDERVDVLLANAVLHWMPDHRALMPALRDRLSPGGCLAVQMPDNLDEPAHRAMRDIAADGPWAGKLADAAQARTTLLAPQGYYECLSAPGCRIEIWRTTYQHVLAAGAPAIVEWFMGSGLRPFLDPLDADERTLFLARYAAAVARSHPAMADGCVLLPFPRVFIVVVRA